MFCSVWTINQLRAFGGGKCGIEIINEDIGNQLIEIYQL